MTNCNRKKILLLTPADPAGQGVGGMVVRDLINSVTDVDFIVYGYSGFLMRDVKYIHQTVTRIFRSAVTRVKILQAIKLFVFRKIFLSGKLKDIERVAVENEVSFIWVTAASTPEIVWLAEKLASNGKEIRTMIWDVPEYLHLHPLINESYMNSFSSVIDRSNSVSVISYAMQRDYLQKYNTKSIVIRHGINYIEPDFIKKDTSKVIKIVFAGSIYCKNEWNSFISALEMAGWQVGGRTVKLYFLGQFPLSEARRPSKAIFLGTKPLAEALQIMSTMDIGYLPYWFDKAYESAARTSFPGKMTAYTAAGLAIFHHAPMYTEVSAFLQSYKFGISCDSLEASQILKSLDKLADMSVTVEFEQARQAALKDELSNDVMAGRFKRFIK